MNQLPVSNEFHPDTPDWFKHWESKTFAPMLQNLRPREPSQFSSLTDVDYALNYFVKRVEGGAFEEFFDTFSNGIDKAKTKRTALEMTEMAETIADEVIDKWKKQRNRQPLFSSKKKKTIVKVDSDDEEEMKEALKRSLSPTY